MIAVNVWLARREGIWLRDLAGIVRGRVLRDVGLGLGVDVLLYVAFGVAIFAGNVVALGLFGPASLMAAPSPTLALPLWCGLWSLLVMPVTVAIAEELFHRGWAQPRLQAITGNRSGLPAPVRCPIGRGRGETPRENMAGRPRSNRPPGRPTPRPTPEQVLAERFARSEIDEQDYHQRLNVLRDHAG